MLQTLLVAQFDPAQVQNAVLHGSQHLLAAAGLLTLVKGSDDAQRQMQAGAAVANLGTGHGRRATQEPGGRG